MLYTHGRVDTSIEYFIFSSEDLGITLKSGILG